MVRPNAAAGRRTACSSFSRWVTNGSTTAPTLSPSRSAATQFLRFFSPACGLRSLIILPFGLWRLYQRPANLSELANAAGLGMTMLVGSQSVAIIGTHLLPAGVAAVFGSVAPIFLALFSWIALREQLGLRQRARFYRPCTHGPVHIA